MNDEHFPTRGDSELDLARLVDEALAEEGGKLAPSGHEGNVPLYQPKTMPLAMSPVTMPTGHAPPQATRPTAPAATASTHAEQTPSPAPVNRPDHAASRATEPPKGIASARPQAVASATRPPEVRAKRSGSGWAMVGMGVVAVAAACASGWLAREKAMAAAAAPASAALNAQAPSSSPPKPVQVAETATPRSAPSPSNESSLSFVVPPRADTAAEPSGAADHVAAAASASPPTKTDFKSTENKIEPSPPRTAVAPLEPTPTARPSTEGAGPAVHATRSSSSRTSDAKGEESKPAAEAKSKPAEKAASAVSERPASTPQPAPAPAPASSLDAILQQQLKSAIP